MFLYASRYESTFKCPKHAKFMAKCIMCMYCVNPLITKKIFSIFFFPYSSFWPAVLFNCQQSFVQLDLPNKQNGVLMTIKYVSYFLFIYFFVCFSSPTLLQKSSCLLPSYACSPLILASGKNTLK